MQRGGHRLDWRNGHVRRSLYTSYNAIELTTTKYSSAYYAGSTR